MHPFTIYREPQQDFDWPYLLTCVFCFCRIHVNIYNVTSAIQW